MKTKFLTTLVAMPLMLGMASSAIAADDAMPRLSVAALTAAPAAPRQAAAVVTHPTGPVLVAGSALTPSWTLADGRTVVKPLAAPPGSSDVMKIVWHYMPVYIEQLRVNPAAFAGQPGYKKILDDTAAAYANPAKLAVTLQGLFENMASKARGFAPTNPRAPRSAISITGGAQAFEAGWMLADGRTAVAPLGIPGGPITDAARVAWHYMPVYIEQLRDDGTFRRGPGVEGVLQRTVADYANSANIAATLRGLFENMASKARGFKAPAAP